MKNPFLLAIMGAVVAHFLIKRLEEMQELQATPASTPPATIADAEAESETMV
jgi:hypothetical protein